MRYSVGIGPKGGIEFRQWTGDDTYRVVSRYVAMPHLSEEQREWVIAAYFVALADSDDEHCEVCDGRARADALKGGK